MPSHPELDKQLLAANIRARRKQMGWSQAQCALAAGVSLLTWGKLENARFAGTISPATAQGAARALGWDVARIARSGETHTVENSIVDLTEAEHVALMALLDALRKSVNTDHR